MAKGLEALFGAWDKDTGGGRDEDGARAIAKAYVKANVGDFGDLQGKTVDELVAMVDSCRDEARRFRDVGMEAEAKTFDDQKLKIDVLLLAAVPKRHVGGFIAQTVEVSF